MKITDYIRDIASQFNVPISDNEMTALFIDLDISENELYTKATSKKAKTALVSVLYKLLITPKTVKEGNFTLTQADRQAIEQYCGRLCGEAGIDNPFDTLQDTVSDRSNLW